MTSVTSSTSRVITDSPVVVALDYNKRDAALAFVDGIDPRDCRLKVGKEMFTLFGPQIVRDLQQRGFDVFLDLKFHDIPNTTAHAVAAAAELGVWMVNVHASGGARMMTAAREALLPFGKDAPLLIAVTVLTSMDENDLRDLGVTLSPAEHAERLARLTQHCGLDGVVCSAQEAVRFKSALGQDFKLVTPGIRPAGSDVGDQRRIMTPEQALAAGVDYMVIGRPVTQSANPAETLKAINASLKKGRNDRFQQPSGLFNRKRAYRRAESESGTSEGGRYRAHPASDQWTKRERGLPYLRY
jgi:orotidine-5'-phosphate decarboxylase